MLIITHSDGVISTEIRHSLVTALGRGWFELINYANNCGVYFLKANANIQRLNYIV